MVSSIVIVLAILFISIKVQKYLSVPNPLTIVLLTLGISYFNPGFLGFTDIHFFSEEMLVFIVLLLLVDAFILRFDELRKNWLSIVYLAGVAVILSILMGVVLLDYTIFAKYNLEIGAIVVLFAMSLATDPVTVVATFKQFRVPHKIKFLAEGESLFNDAVALIMFLSIGIYMMQGNDLTVFYVSQSFILMIFGSSVIGISIGIIGIYLMKTTKDTLTELVIVLLIAYLSFYAAEHYHLSGLLAEIVAVITMTTIIEKSYYRNKSLIENKTDILEHNNNIKERTKEKILKSLTMNITDIKRQDDVATFLNVIAMLVNVFLFSSLAVLVDFDKIILYWREILTMFVLTTIIRFLMMGKFAFISNKTSKITNIDIKSWLVLTFAGIKGGLSIVMLYILSSKVPNFPHFEMFVSVVTGIIFLSMFLYTFGMVLTIKLNQKSFDKEIELDGH